MSTVPLDSDSSKPLTTLNPKLWYINGEAYDFTDFISRHPGGEQAISLGQGRDCTSLFQTYHTNLPSNKLLQKYKLKKKDGSANNRTFTYNKNGFYRTLKKRTVKYFKDNNIKHTKGGAKELLLWQLNVSVFLICGYFSFINHHNLSFPTVLVLCIIFAISKALLIVRSTHSASHYTLSIYPSINRFVHWFNMCLIDDSPQQWTAKHIVAHHIDTNVVPIDNDSIYPIKRILVPLERLWFHKYQHIYMFLMYPFTLSGWATTSIANLFFGLLLNHGRVYVETVECKFDTFLDYLEAISSAIINYVIRLSPFIFLSTWEDAIIMALIFESVSSTWFSLQFVVNHEVIETALNESSQNHNKVHSESNEHRDFGAHQVMTSHNYAIKNPWALQVSGGLNYQVEHHLFPSIHFKHYPALSKIVQKTCKEFNLPYHESETFVTAVKKHYQLLRVMGSQDVPELKKSL